MRPESAGPLEVEPPAWSPPARTNALLDRTPHPLTGDFLFPGGPGKTWSPGDFTSLMNDLESRVFEQFPDQTWFYPGHGKDSAIGVEGPHLAEWHARGW